MILAGTGHRPRKLGNEWRMNGPISQRLCLAVSRFLFERKPDRVISGGALGFDQLLAIAALSLDIPVTIAVPHDGQDAKWDALGKERYRDLLAHPRVTRVDVNPGPYAAWKLIARDEWMVENSDELLTCWDGIRGGSGTFKTISHAESLNRPIHHLPYDEILQCA